MIFDSFVSLLDSFLTDAVITEIVYPVFALAFLVTVPSILKFIWR